MFTIKNILFPTDFSRCAAQALPYALYFAEKYNATLHMLHGIVLHSSDPDTPDNEIYNIEEVFKKLKANADVQMTTNIRDHDIEDLDIVQVQERAISSTELILEYSDEHAVDMIIMGTHGRRGIGHAFLGSVAEEVVRSASCPVLTIREQKRPKPLERLDRILVPFDYSKHAIAALEYAKEIAALYHARLELLYVFEEIIYPRFYDSGDELNNYIKENGRKTLESIYEETKGPDVDHSIHILGSRHVAYEILNFANNSDIDLVVIATHGMSGLQHFLLGSVAEKVVRRSPCPVFTVKPFGKSLIS